MRYFFPDIKYNTEMTINEPNNMNTFLQGSSKYFVAHVNEDQFDQTLRGVS